MIGCLIVTVDPETFTLSQLDELWTALIEAIGDFCDDWGPVRCGPHFVLDSVDMYQAEALQKVVDGDASLCDSVGVTFVPALKEGARCQSTTA